MKSAFAPKLSFACCACACAAFAPRSLWACAACYGQSDSPMAAGMNWGIVSLLGIIVLMLGGVASFFFFLAKRSARAAQANAAAVAESWDANWPAVDESPANAPLARGGLRRLSNLAQRREHCAKTMPGSVLAPGSRGRN